MVFYKQSCTELVDLILAIFVLFALGHYKKIQFLRKLITLWPFPSRFVLLTLYYSLKL